MNAIVIFTNRHQAMRTPVLKAFALAVVAAILVGIIPGISLLSGLIGNHREAVASGAEMPSDAGVGAGACALTKAAPHTDHKQLTEAEKIAAHDPKDSSAWIQLGNRYFDADQPARAIDAYDKALESNPNNLEVLVDQGNCYRKIRRYDKAVSNFAKALQLDPQYEQGLVNLGIVCAVNLKQPEKALKAWSRFLELNPSSPASRQVRLWVEQLKANPRALAE